MSAPAAIVLGDWGSTSCRLHLLVGGRAVDGAFGEGIKTSPDPSLTYRVLTRGWRDEHGALPALLCGTVGANIGWVDAGYVPAPARLTDMLPAAVTPPGAPEVRVLPGVACEANAFGLPDVMRAEEMQAWGAQSVLDRPRTRLCLPGTHCKWVDMDADTIGGVTTGFTGELFAALTHHTMLAGPGEVRTSDAFRAGVELGATHPSLVSALFHTRAEAARNRMDGREARERLSGLLIGADCAGMLAVWGCPPDAVVGAPGIAGAYAAGLATLGHEVPVLDGQDMLLAALRRVAEQAGLL